MEDIRASIRARYGQAMAGRRGEATRGSGCAGVPDLTRIAYDEATLAEASPDAALQSFGCGNPTAEVGLRPGERVLDLGCGAGLDLLLSARAVGPLGHVIGLDMTDEMLHAASKNVARQGNISLVRGYLEDIPLADGTLDVVLSNCAINLSPDKEKCLSEVFRVLRPGGRLCVADIVLLHPLSERAAKSLALWSSCVSGALSETEYVALLEKTGFTAICMRRTATHAFPDTLASMAFPDLTPDECHEMDGALASAIVEAVRPVL